MLLFSDFNHVVKYNVLYLKSNKENEHFCNIRKFGLFCDFNHLVKYYVVYLKSNKENEKLSNINTL